VNRLFFTAIPLSRRSRQAYFLNLSLAQFLGETSAGSGGFDSSVLKTSKAPRVHERVHGERLPRTLIHKTEARGSAGGLTNVVSSILAK